MSAGNNFGETGWCANIAHPDHLHRLNDRCENPTTLDERLDEMRKVARETGRMDELTHTIEKMREQAANKAFWSLVGPLQIENHLRQQFPKPKEGE